MALERIGEIAAAGDLTTASLVRQEGSASRRAVDERVSGVAADIIASSPTVISSAAAATQVVARPLINEALGGTRRVRVSLTLPGGRTGTLTPDQRTSVAHRLPIFLPADSIRWRIWMRNANFRDTATYSTTLAMAGFWFGRNTVDAFGQPTGVWAETPTQIVGAFSHQGSAAYYTSPWVTDPAQQIKGRTEHLFGYAYTQPAAADVHRGLSGGWTSDTAGDVAALSGAGFTQTPYAPLDIWLEVEVAASVPIWCVIGDSIAVGTGTKYPIRDSAYQKLAIAHGAMPMLFAQHGSTMDMWNQPTQAKWTSWAGTGVVSRPDVVIWEVGSNDIFANGGVDLVTAQTRFAALLPIVQANLSSNIILTTITPRNGSESDVVREGVRVAYNNWLQSDLPGGAMTCWDVSAAVESGPGAVATKYMSSDNVHPNTAGQARFMTAMGSAGAAPARVHDPRLPLHSLPVAAGLRWVSGRLYGDTGETIGEWVDEVNGSRATVGTYNRPRIVSGQGGRRALLATGSEGFSISLTRTPPYTMIVVQRLLAVPASSGIFVGGGASSQRGAMFVNNAGKLIVNGASSLTSSASIPVGAASILIGVQAGASSVASVDGVETAGNAGSETSSVLNLLRYASANSGPNAEIYEIIYYPFALTAEQRTQTVTALRAVYGI